MSRETHRTMAEFARASGISRPTLSKYFDDPESVRSGTRERIEAALRASDYQPNHYARNLNRKRTRNIGILIPSNTDPFYAEMVSRIELRCREAGYWPIVISSHGAPRLEAEAIGTLLSLKVAGAIVAPLGSLSSPRLFERLVGAMPVVHFDAPIASDAPFVGSDNRQSIATIIDYLCRSGEPPVYFDIPHVNRNSDERLASYVESMERLGEEPVVIGDTATYTWDFERIGFEQMQALLDAGRRPAKTILCANDRLAFGVMAAAFSRGLKIGRLADCDLRVAAHDDHPLSRYTCPALTTMAQDFAGMAARCTDIMLDLLGEEAPSPPRITSVRLAAKLVMRQSA